MCAGVRYSTMWASTRGVERACVCVCVCALMCLHSHTLVALGTPHHITPFTSVDHDTSPAAETLAFRKTVASWLTKVSVHLEAEGSLHHALNASKLSVQVCWTTRAAHVCVGDALPCMLTRARASESKNHPRTCVCEWLHTCMQVLAGFTHALNHKACVCHCVRRSKPINQWFRGSSAVYTTS